MTTPSSVPHRSSDATRRRLITLALILGAIFLGPLIVPIPRAGESLPPRELATRDSRFATAGGVELHYREWGSSDSTRTVVLLHGFGASAFSWRDAGPALADSGYRVIAIDRTGFGLTERPRTPLLGWARRSPYSLAAQADQAAELCGRLGVKHAVVVGHSQGAGAAILMATRHPRLVDGVVLAAPALETAWTNGPARWLLATPQARRLGPVFVRRIAGPASDDLLRTAFSDEDNVTAAVIEGYRRPLRALDWDRGLWEQSVASQPERPDDRVSALRTSGRPALVIVPLSDRLVDPEGQLTVARDLGAQEHHVAGGGHVYHEEHPREFAEIVATFIERSIYPAPPCDTGG